MPGVATSVGVFRVERRTQGGQEQLGQAEVEDLDVPVLRDKDVLGLDVAVDDPLLVRRGEALRDLDACSSTAFFGGRGAPSFSRSDSPCRSSETMNGLPSCVPTSWTTRMLG